MSKEASFFCVMEKTEAEATRLNGTILNTAPAVVKKSTPAVCTSGLQ